MTVIGGVYLKGGSSTGSGPFMTLLRGAAPTLPLAVRAQQAKRMGRFSMLVAAEEPC
jgi:hypothetical protein